MLFLVVYLLQGLLNVPVLQRNATSCIEPQIEAGNFRQGEFENTSTPCTEHILYGSTENQSMLNVRNVGNGEQTAISKDSSVQQKSERKLSGSDKIKGSVLSSAAQNFKLFDPEWDPTFHHNNHSVPNIIMNLYQSMQTTNSTDFAQKFDLIKCLRVTEYAYTANGIIVKFGFNGTQIVEQIVRTELYVYRFSQRVEKASTDSNIIRLYQILSKGGMGPRDDRQNVDIHELLGVIYVSPYDQGWQIFNVEKSLEKWKNGEPTLNFLISVTDTWGNIIDPKYLGLDFTKSSNSPLLVMHLRQFSETLNSTMVSNCHKEATLCKNANQPQELENPPTKDEPTTVCNRRPFYLDFKKGAFANFMIHPKGLMLHKCTGKCQLGLIDNFTSHSKLLSIFQKTNGTTLSESYCVPNKYAPATLVFYDRSANIVIRKYYDIIVESCSCR